MSMAIDNLALKKITLDLEEELVGAFFDKPFALSTNQFALPYHSGKNVENKGRGSLIGAKKRNTVFFGRLEKALKSKSS